MDYQQLLEHSFAVEKQHHGECAPESPLQYLSQHIFDFTTYDSAMDELFAAKAVQVCAAVSNRTTFEYIQEPESYKWFLLMCNMPFFETRLEWGTSIRGAWWDSCALRLKSYGLWNGDEQITELEFDSSQWNEFIAAVVTFSTQGGTHE